MLSTLPLSAISNMAYVYKNYPSGDETNPGDFVNSFFTFCNWNLNSLAKDDFYRIELLEAHNSLHNYDFISICETSLKDTVELPEVLMENYTFVL